MSMEKDIQHISSTIGDLKQVLIDLQHTAGEQSVKLDRLETAVIGDDKRGIDGVVGQVKKHGAYIETDRKQKWVLAGILLVLSTVLKDSWHTIVSIFSR